jgi:predicted RNA-binding Zn ribbon-like protein
VSDFQGFQPAGRSPAPPPLDLVQDFVNTEIAEWARDDIATPDELSSWLRARGLLGADEAVDADVFVHARALRGVLRGLALANTLGAPPDDALRSEFESAVERVRFVPQLDAAGRIRVAPEAGGARALAVLLTRVLDAQADGTWNRLKACRKESCQWLFYDASRNASSTWCSMSICGNRAKTAAYRRRRARA